MRFSFSTAKLAWCHITRIGKPDTKPPPDVPRQPRHLSLSMLVGRSQACYLQHTLRISKTDPLQAFLFCLTGTPALLLTVLQSLQLVFNLLQVFRWPSRPMKNTTCPAFLGRLAPRSSTDARPLPRRGLSPVPAVGSNSKTCGGRARSPLLVPFKDLIFTLLILNVGKNHCVELLVKLASH